MSFASPASRPWFSPWGGVYVLLVVAGVGAPFAIQLRPRTISHVCLKTNISTMPELAERIRHAHPSLHIVPIRANGDISWGFFVCEERPSSADELTGLRGLTKTTDVMDDWQGIVVVETSNPAMPVREKHPKGYDLLAVPFYLFGDPVAIQRIRDVLISESPR